MSTVHQGKLIKSWIEKKYDSTNRFAATLAVDAKPEDFIKIQSKYVNLVRNIAALEFVKQHFHTRWNKEVAPQVGSTLQQILKEMGESDISRAQGMAPDEYQKELYIMQGKYEAAMENNKMIVTELRDLVISLKTDK